MSGGAFDYFYIAIQDVADRPEFSKTTERQAFRHHLRKVAEALKAIEWNESGDGDDNESYLIRACLAKTDVLYTAIEEAEEMLVTLEEEVARAKQSTGERAMYHVSPEMAGQLCTVKYRIPAQGSLNRETRACIRLDGGIGDIFVPEHCLKPIGNENELNVNECAAMARQGKLTSV